MATTHPLAVAQAQYAPTTDGQMQTFDVGVPFDVPTTLVSADVMLTSPSWQATVPPTNIVVSIEQSFDVGQSWLGWRSTTCQSGDTGKGGQLPTIAAPGDGLARRARVRVATDRTITLGANGSWTSNP